VAEPDQLALHPPVPPPGVLCRDADHERADRRRRGRPPQTPAARVVPLARDQPTVPGEHRRRGHRKHLIPPAARDQSRQRRQPQPVGWLVADPADLATQDRVLVPEHQDFGVLGHPVPRQHRQAAEQAAYEQVENGNDHSAMIPARKPDQARSNNRAPHGGQAVPGSPGKAEGISRQGPRQRHIPKGEHVLRLEGPPRTRPRATRPGRPRPGRHPAGRAACRIEQTIMPWHSTMCIVSTCQCLTLWSAIFARPSERRGRRKIEQPGGEVLTEPCPGVFTQFGPWIVI
jgi:hypothetical protein